MSNAFTILIVGADPKLSAEIESALESLDEVRGVVYSIPEPRQAIEAARSRAPELVILEMTADLSALAAFANELGIISPDTTLAGAFRDDVFGNDVPESTYLIEALHAGVKDFLHRPVSMTELRSLIARLSRPTVREESTGTIVSFVSNKGGVGKSTLSVNVACGLAKRHPDRVLLIDASLQMGVCASMLDLEPRTSLTDAVQERHRLDATLLRRLAVRHPCGLHLLAAPANAVDAAEVDDDVMSRILTLARRSYDYVIVDTFPMFDRVIVAILDMSDRTYVVTEAGVPVLQGGVKLVQLLNRIGFPDDRLKIVLSRHLKIAGGLTPAEVSRRLGRTIDHVIPYDKRVLICANTGEPYMLRGSIGFFGGFVRSLRPLIADLESLREPASQINGTSSLIHRRPHSNGLSPISESPTGRDVGGDQNE